jgi:hypothetical protein
MYTSVLVIALLGFSESPAPESPTWMSDYNAARKLGREQKKPLVVIIGNGEAGWNGLSRKGTLSKEARRLLATEFVCVYADTKAKEGQQLAASFDMPQGPGVVISDRKGELQAFRHEGDLANGTLLRYLRRYADPEFVARVTETNPPPARRAAPQPAYAPPVFYGFMGGGGGGGC